VPPFGGMDQTLLLSALLSNCLDPDPKGGQYQAEIASG
jgi:hypothetical protein